MFIFKVTIDCYNRAQIYVIIQLYLQHPSETARHVAYASIAQELDGVKGKFFTNSRECWNPPGVNNKQLCESIWAASEKLVGLKSSEKLS